MRRRNIGDPSLPRNSRQASTPTPHSGRCDAGLVRCREPRPPGPNRPHAPCSVSTAQWAVRARDELGLAVGRTASPAHVACLGVHPGWHIWSRWTSFGLMRRDIIPWVAKDWVRSSMGAGRLGFVLWRAKFWGTGGSSSPLGFGATQGAHPSRNRVKRGRTGAGFTLRWPQSGGPGGPVHWFNSPLAHNNPRSSDLGFRVWHRLIRPAMRAGLHIPRRITPPRSGRLSMT